MISISRTVGLAPLFSIPMLLVAGSPTVQAQGRGGITQPPLNPKASAPADFTGYWVSVVVEDWRYRMLTPPKGDYTGLPLNDKARKIADAWDAAKDATPEDQCKSYAAPSLMRIPGRVHISWQDDQTLKAESDAGKQTRLFYFGVPKGPAGEWQGLSQAAWEEIPASRGAPLFSGSLRIVTTGLKPGYLRKNGVPFSANATLTEFFDRVVEPDGDTYLIITTTVNDPEYLVQPYLTTTHFKKEADASGWNPTPCGAP